MAVSLRVYRQRIRSVQSIAKITRAFELISEMALPPAESRTLIEDELAAL